MKKQKHNAEEPEKEVVNDTAQQEQEANQQTENQTTEEEGDKIANEIAELTQKCNDLNDKNLRLMAEFDNYRKRTLKERSDLIKTAGENILSSMLPLVDDFERALKAMETAEDVVAVKEGVDLIYNKFIAFLLQNGVKAIPTDNEVFNTDLHEAITTFPAPTCIVTGKQIGRAHV